MDEGSRSGRSTRSGERSRHAQGRGAGRVLRLPKRRGTRWGVAAGLALVVTATAAGVASASPDWYRGPFAARHVAAAPAARHSLGPAASVPYCWGYRWCRPPHRTGPTASGSTSPGTTAPPTSPASEPPTTPPTQPTTEPTQPTTEPTQPTTEPTQPTTATPSTTAPTTSVTTSPPAGAGDALAQQILAQLNQARAEAGVSALTMSAGLVRSAAAHTQLMIDGCGLSHQCSGEAGLGERISAAGVTWRAVGENIGYGGPVARTDAAIVAMGKQLTSSMLAETAPNDGHRRNILNAGFAHVGITLVQDAKGTVWMTQDFSN